MKQQEIIRLIDEDFPRLGPITKEVKETTIQESVRYRGAVRLSTGTFWTDDEYTKFRRKVLSTPLP